MNAKKCDRCGKYFAVKRSIRALLVDALNYDKINYNLCSDCGSILKEWVHNNQSKTGNEIDDEYAEQLVQEAHGSD